MIQRKQSIYLLLAALLNAGVFFFDLYQYHTQVSGTDTLGKIRVNDNFVALIIATLITLLPLITIFLFNNRKRQISLSMVSILGIFSFIALLLWRVNGVPPPVNGSYWIGSVLPVISLVFLIMAIMGIRSDEKLVKSVDRLR